MLELLQVVEVLVVDLLDVGAAHLDGDGVDHVARDDLELVPDLRRLALAQHLHGLRAVRPELAPDDHRSLRMLGCPTLAFSSMRTLTLTGNSKTVPLSSRTSTLYS